MPYTLKTQQIAVKDPDTGVYSGVDILTEQTTEGLLTEIIATGTEVKTDVAAQMATERSDFNTYVTTKEAELDQYKSTTETNINNYVTTKNQEIATMITEADEDVSNLEDRKQDVADAVSDMLGQGVDNTLTTANVPAESKAVGDLFETVVQGKSTQPSDKWNRLWIKPSASDYEIPTMDEFDDLKSALNVQNSKYNEIRNNSIADSILYGSSESVAVTLSNGGLSGNVGDIIEITSTSSYKYSIVDVETINALLVGLSATNSNSYPYYVYACDSNGKILERFIPKQSIDAYHCQIITVPKECKNVYIMTASTISVKKFLADEQPYIKSVNILPPFTNDFGYFDTGSQKWISSAGSKASMFIPVTSGETLYYSSTRASWVGFFDENYTYLTRVKFEASNDVSLPSEIIVPSNNSIRYMLVTISTNYENIGNLMVTRIPTPQVFIPHGKIRSRENTLYDKRVMVFGDSISFKQIRWFSTFLALTQPLDWKDYAVNGCQWCDTRYDTTYPYEGNPSSDDSNNNVMGNQVQKAINEHAFDPDYILMFCGTNDNFRYDADTTMEQQFTDSEGNAVALSNVMRYTIAGSMRWCVENLKTAFPGAKISIITPIQCAYGVRKINIQTARNDRILETAHRLGCEAFNAWGESNIYSALETSGAMGQYLVDGLHPYPPTGGKILGLYITNKVLSAVGVR